MDSENVTRLRLDQARPAKYARSFEMPDGSISVMGIFKVSDEGRTVKVCTDAGHSIGLTSLVESRMNTFFSREGLFLALNNKVVPAAEAGTYVGTIWRSVDDLTSVQQEKTTVIVPEAGKVDFGEPGEWSGLIFHRAIVELSDGSLLAAMYGNFEADTTAPTNPHSKRETKFKPRAFTVRSEDAGRTWRYLASVAVPDPAVTDDTEGFNEWTIARLADGRLLGVIRTGHFTPLVASWSSDEGKTWTSPMTPPELGPGGCDPYLIKLADERLALAYGEMVQPPADREKYFQEYETRWDKRRRCRLAISTDKTGENWRTLDLCDYDDRSAYPSIFEVAPNVLLYQSDLDLWRVEV